MQIKTTMRYHLIPVRMANTKMTRITSVGEDVEKRELLYTADGNVNWHSYCGKQYGGSSKKSKIELPYNPEIPLLGIYLKKMKTVTGQDIFSPCSLQHYLQ